MVRPLGSGPVLPFVFYTESRYVGTFRKILFTFDAFIDSHYGIMAISIGGV